MAISAYSDIEFGSFLLEKELITQEQLTEAIERQKIKGGYLSQNLIELEHIKDEDVTVCLTCQYGYCYLPLESYNISDAAFDSIPLKLICDFCVLPIEKNDRLLSIVMADPLNKGVLEILRHVSGCELIVFISTRHEIKEAVKNFYNVRVKNFELDKFSDDPILRDNLFTQYVANGLYSGPSRRRYKRLYTHLPTEYYSYPNIVKTRVMNISMSGVLIESNSSLPFGSQMSMNIHFDQKKFITGVVEVCRYETKNLIDVVLGSESQAFYELGAFFNFMSDENQYMLADFLRQRLNA